MAICLRTVSNKLTPIKKLVSQGKHITLTRPERHLPQQSLKSNFLEEFLFPNYGNVNAITACKQTYACNDFLRQGQDPLNLLEDWHDTTNDAFRDTRLQRYERNGGHSNAEEVVSDCDSTNLILHTERLYCFDPFSVPVRSFGATPDDIILWNADINVEHFNEQHEVDFSRLEYRSFTNEKDGHTMLTDNAREKFVVADEKRAINRDSQQGYQKPSEDQLQRVLTVLSNTLSNIFDKPFDFSIYHKDIVFENNIQGKRSEGIVSYMKQVTWLKTVGHFRFAFVKFEILKITMHPEDGTVKVRWRIRGLSGLQVMSRFWKHKVWKLKESFDNLEVWYDGFSTFYVGGDGLVYKHVADKMMPDDDRVANVKNNHFATKLALLVAAASQEGFSEVNTLLSSSLKQHCTSSMKLPLLKIG